jgi:hypothetical protein
MRCQLEGGGSEVAWTCAWRQPAEGLWNRLSYRWKRTRQPDQSRSQGRPHANIGAGMISIQLDASGPIHAVNG